MDRSTVSATTRWWEVKILAMLTAVATALIAIVPSVPGVAAQEAGCDAYSSQGAAQFALDINPALAPTLDPDGNGVACDDAADAALQIPPDGAPSPTPSGQNADADVGVDAIDQQPTGPIGIPTPQTTAAPGDFTGRLGGDRAGWVASFGPPIDAQEGANPSIVVGTSTPPAGVASLVTLWFDDQTFIILLTAGTPWTPDVGAQLLTDLLPQDILTIPQGEVLPDGSLLIPMVSDQLAAQVTLDAMALAGVPGVPGDLYVVIVPVAGGQKVAELEIGVGNGDNVREDAAEPTPAS